MKFHTPLCMEARRSFDLKAGVIFLAIIFSLLLPLCSAKLGNFKQNECVDIKTILNATAVNISTISYPNSTVAIRNEVMNKDGSTFNYTFCDTIALGVYNYDYFTLEGSVYVNDFEITYTGEKVTQEQIYIYLFGLLFLIFLIFGTIAVINKLPSRDSVDDRGAIININNLKHLRGVLWIVVWTFCLAIVFILFNLALAYIPNSMMGNFLFVVYQLMFWITIIGIPINFIWIFYKVFKDKEMKRMIERGAEFRGIP